MVAVGATFVTTSVAAVALAVRSTRKGRVQVTGDVLEILGIAMRDAEQRGHRPATVTHLALAILAEPTIARDLDERGVSLEDLYDDIERLLPPRGDAPVTLTLRDGEESDIVPLLKASGRHGGFGPGPRHVFRALLESEHQALRDVFARHGVTAGRLPPPSSPKLDAGSPPRRPEVGPYRGAPNVNASSEVILWNDKKTTMPFVIELLRGSFGVVEPQATRLMLAIHRDGLAVVGTYERHEAERLARTSMQFARDNGFPLKVTVEDAGRLTSMSRVARWLYRRG